MKEKFKDSLRKRRELAHQQNDTQYQEEDFEELFEGSISNEPEAAISYLMEKNQTLIE